MIFILHYILFNAGLPAVIILLTLFLQSYSEASMAEIGALLMVLPFVSILIKPLFCALADRRQAHKRYLIYALVLMAAGYGSLTVAPFFPDLLAEHGRLVWYLDVVGIVVGFSAFGLVWSLGDALALNHAQMAGVTWGAYRVWGTVSWGVFGILIGQINEVALLPRYVPGLLVLVVALLAEAGLLLAWPNRHFVMGGTLGAAGAQAEGQGQGRQEEGADWQGPAAKGQGSRTGTLGSTRADPRMVGALANMLIEDLGGTLRSSLRGNQRPKRRPLDELIEQHRMSSVRSTAAAAAAAGGEGEGGGGGGGGTGDTEAGQRPATPPSSHNTTQNTSSASNPTPWASDSYQASAQPESQESFLRRTQAALARMNSLSAASGHVVAKELATGAGPQTTPTSELAASHRRLFYMSSLASNASLGRVAAAHALAQLEESPVGPGARDQQRQQQQVAPSPGVAGAAQHPLSAELVAGKGAATSLAAPKEAEGGGPALRSAEDLQLMLLKLIVLRDRAILKYLALFTIFGALLICHLSFFFVNLEQLCREHQADFSTAMGAMLAAHSISEVLSFTLVVPHLIPRVGRSGGLLTCALIYALRFAYYGSYLAEASPYTAVPFEFSHGIVYGIVYSLITDISFECVNQVDLYLPQLVARGLVEPTMNPAELKLQLRATMQGLFSGAFDGLGNGLGALFGGVFLDSHPFVELWAVCAWVSFGVAGVYLLTDWRTMFAACRKPSSAGLSACKLAA